MELYRKHRPETLAQIYGNETVKSTVQSLIDNSRRPHTYLLVGPAGCGKTTLAYIMAKAFGATNIVENNSADYRGIDSSRDLSAVLGMHSLFGVSAYILEEAHKMTQDAQEALLKPVENCPEDAYLFFTTTDPSKINAALKTRMVILQVSLLTDSELEQVLADVTAAADVTLTPNVLAHIAGSAYGSPRRALVMLESVIGLSEEDALNVAGYADTTDKVAIDLCRALVQNGASWKNIASILSSITVEPEAVRRAVLGYLRSILLKKESPKAYIMASAFIEPYYHTGNAGLLLSCYTALMGVRELK